MTESDRPSTRGDRGNDPGLRPTNAAAPIRPRNVVAIGVAVLLGASVFAGAVSSPSTPDPSPVVAAAVSPSPAPSHDTTVEPTSGATPTPRPSLAVTPTPATVPTPTQTTVASPTLPPPSTPTPTQAPTPTPTPPPLGSAPAGPTETATVLRVIDGDTIEVDRGRGPESVRYIGIDTPETVHPSEPVEWMGAEASAANRRFVEGREVVLESDVSDVDQYGRLLRYVWTREEGGWIFVNLALITKGFAQVSTYPPDVRYVDLYLQRQEIARQNEAGLWGTPPPTPEPEPEPAVPVLPLAGNCDASYPGVCIPPAPPDLDCGQIDHRRFEVVGSDAHGFDGDGDGVGCESS